MELKKLLDTRPETLAKEQHDALKKHAVEILRNVANLLNSEKYDEVEKLLLESPAGDAYGCDNTFIDFGCLFSNTNNNDDTDIGQIVYHLKRLKGLS